MLGRLKITLCVGFSLLFSVTAHCAAAAESLIAAQYGKIPEATQIKKIVSAGPVADTFLMSLAPNKLMGFSTHALSAESKKFLPAAIQNLPNTGRIAGRATTFPMEKLIALKPDIVFDIGDVNASFLDSAKRVHEQTGLTYVLMSGRIADSGEQLRQAGRLLGEPERGNAQGAIADRFLNEAKRVNAKYAGRQPKIYYGRGADGMETGLLSSIHSEQIDLLGAVNVAGAAGESKTARVSLEQLLLWDPDVIVTGDPNFFNLLKKGGAWAQLRAVKNQRFYLAPALPFGWLGHPPSINRLLGILWLERLLYPQELSQDAFRQQVQNFYQKFYDFTLTDAAFAVLVNP
jgi:iron complex transport system substrate-binding protein